MALECRINRFSRINCVTSIHGFSLGLAVNLHAGYASSTVRLRANDVGSFGSKVDLDDQVSQKTQGEKTL